MLLEQTLCQKEAKEIVCSGDNVGAFPGITISLVYSLAVSDELAEIEQL